MNKRKPKISVYIAASLDGYIARKDESLDWLERVHMPGEDYGYQEFFASVDALILGRKTYEIAASIPNWSYEGKRIIVLSQTTTKTIRGDVERFSGDLVGLVHQLSKEEVKHIWVDGGVTISHFLRAQLVDQIILSIIPILLGAGIPLFHVMDKELPCHLISSQAYASGLVQLRYEVGEKQKVTQ